MSVVMDSSGVVVCDDLQVVSISSGHGDTIYRVSRTGRLLCSAPRKRAQTEIVSLLIWRNCRRVFRHAATVRTSREESLA